jgi:hypothetical protein
VGIKGVVAELASAAFIRRTSAFAGVSFRQCRELGGMTGEGSNAAEGKAVPGN